MFTLQRLSASCFLILCLLGTVLAQDQQSSVAGPKASQTSSTVTASATTERVRFTAPSNVVRMQLQVISESGQILFEVSSKGNVLDWSMQDGSGQRAGFIPHCGHGEEFIREIERKDWLSFGRGEAG